MIHRIGFDAKRLFNNFTGLGNYSRTLLRNLSEYHPDEAYFLYTPKVRQTPQTQFFLDSPTFNLRVPRRTQLLWRTYGMKKDIKRDKLDLYHGLSHEIPVGLPDLGVPTVVTIHDLIFKHYPEQYPWFDRQVYNQKFRYACENSDLIIAISESTKRDVMEMYGIAEEKIRVIYQSCHEGFMLEKNPSTKEAVRERYGLPTEFLFYVGSLVERKNLLGIVEALAQLPVDLQLPVVVVGQGAVYKRRVVARAQELGVLDKLLFIQPEFAELPALYQQAQAFLYPSVYEGFGIPILEALFSKTPVLTSNMSSLPEAAGAGAILVDPRNATEMAAGIETLLTDSEQREQQITAGFEHAQQFKGELLTAQLVDAYRSLLG
ncbi:MAG: glycosyltransferase family 1 protein [Bacteroidota bacterium]